MTDQSPYSDSNGDTDVRLDRGWIASAPGWVKVFGVIVIALILLFVVLQFTGVGGEHGPGRHTPSGSSGDTPFLQQP